MGYYTAYSLQLEGEPEEVEAFEKDLLEISKYNGEVNCCVDELIDSGNCYAKLYDLEGWITDVAKKHPGVLVELFGDGESSDDLWEARWKGDEYERQYSIIPPFKNENLLTEKEKDNKLKTN